MTPLTPDDLDDSQGKLYLRYRHHSGKVGEFELTLDVLKEWIKSQSGEEVLALTPGQQDYDFSPEITDIQGDHQLLIKGEDWTQISGVLHFDVTHFPIADDTYVKLKYWKT